MPPLNAQPAQVLTAGLVALALSLSHAPCQEPPFRLAGAPLRQTPSVLPDEALALDTVPEDLNADGIVDAGDLAIFAADGKLSKGGGPSRRAPTSTATARLTPWTLTGP